MPVDGRAARSHRSRRAIVDAMRALHAEGDLRPTAPRVAKRAGVSLRTVWQQFADMETLLIEAIRRDQEVLRSLTKRIDPDQALADRVAQFTGQRSRVLEHMTPTWRAARLAEPFSPQLQQNKILLLERSQHEIETIFAPELETLHDSDEDQDESKDLLHSLQAISIWSFWESLRTDLGLAPDQAAGVLRETFSARLAAAGFGRQNVT